MIACYFHLFPFRFHCHVLITGMRYDTGQLEPFQNPPKMSTVFWHLLSNLWPRLPLWACAGQWACLQTHKNVLDPPERETTSLQPVQSSNALPQLTLPVFTLRYPRVVFSFFVHVQTALMRTLAFYLQTTCPSLNIYVCMYISVWTSYRTERSICTPTEFTAEHLWTGTSAP